MSDTLRDQLLGLGFKPSPKPAREHDKRGKGAVAKTQSAIAKTKNAPGIKSGRDAPRRDKPKRSREEIDLAKAYAIRAQKEKAERIEAERQKQEAARQRREARAKLAELLKDKALNAADAEIARHFPYGGKIKRIYVTAEQLTRLNAGELGVVQLDGRYLLVDAATLAQTEALYSPAVALKVDPDAPAEADPYSDPKYQVPDDLVW
jgi:uncharacterized protein YaiL (DUF2058 family)